MSDRLRLMELARLTDPEATLTVKGKKFVAWHKRFYFNENDELIKVERVEKYVHSNGDPRYEGKLYWQKSKNQKFMHIRYSTRSVDNKPSISRLRLMYKPPEGYLP